MAEIIQLKYTDIKQSDNVWIFDINELGDNQVKSKSAIRSVPIHSQLIELGLLDYVNAVSKIDNRLFPNESRTKLGKFKIFGDRFKRYRDKKGVIKKDNEMLDFHSFRHTVRTKLLDCSVDSALIDKIIGHASNGSTGDKVYTHTQLIPQKQEAINRLKYDIEFKSMKRWNNCIFSRELRM